MEWMEDRRRLGGKRIGGKTYVWRTWPLEIYGRAEGALEEGDILSCCLVYSTLDRVR